MMAVAQRRDDGVQQFGIRTRRQRANRSATHLPVFVA